MIHKVMLVISSNGFHPIEYSVPKRILEHSGITVITASDKTGKAIAKDETTADIDVSLDTVTTEDFDSIFFIGGPGALNHLDNETSYELIKQAAEAKKPFGAICSSVRILAHAGVLNGKKVTGWNEDHQLPSILQASNATYTPKDVVVDGNIVTAVGPDAAQEFGAKILGVLGLQ